MLILPKGNPLKSIVSAISRVRSRGVPYKTIFFAGALDVFRPMVRQISKLGLCLHGTCPICHCNAVFEFKNLRYTLLKCETCEHVFVCNSISSEDLEKNYSRSDYWEEDKIHRNIHSMEPGPHWKEFVDRRINPMRELNAMPPLRRSDGSRSRILEIGSSEGIVLYHLSLMGYEVYGCELNQEIVSRARKYFSHPVIVDHFLSHDFEELRFDTIISYHTFEHLTNLREIIRKCSDLLVPCGSLLFEVPYGVEEYHNYDHLHFFSEKSAKRLMSDWFEDIKVMDGSYVTIHQVKCGSYFVTGKKPEKGTVR